MLFSLLHVCTIKQERRELPDVLLKMGMVFAKPEVKTLLTGQVVIVRTVNISQVDKSVDVQRVILCPFI